MSGGEDVAVVGLGIHEFGRHDGVSGLEMGAIAARRALASAGISWEDVDFAAGGSDAAGNADTSVSMLGLTGVPFINVKNGCATGGSALTTAHAMLVSGAAEVALVVGFDKHPRGAFNPLPEEWGIGSWYGETGLMLTTQFFAMKIQRYMAEHDITSSTLAKVAAKAFSNGSRNPNAWRRAPLSEEEILSSKMVNNPLTQYMFCSPGEGAVALVLARGPRIKQLTSTPVYLRSVAFRTRRFGSFEVFSPSIPIESAPSATTEAAAAAFEEAGIGPGDVDVAQIQDTESGAEIMHLAETGLCEHGEQEALIQSGDTELSGRLPINTDGGCLACGEPIGASGLRQVHEIVLQLRGEAGDHQVPKPCRVGFTQVYGAPGVSACTVLTAVARTRRARRSPDGVAGVDRQRDAGDVLGGVRAQEQDGVGHVARFDPRDARQDVQSLERLADVILGRVLQVRGEQLERRVVDHQRRSHGRGAHRVDADPMLAELLREHLHQADHAVLGRGVVRGVGVGANARG